MEPASRLLRLLSLLQARPDWSGNELADRLGVEPRTVRRDIARLRALGYPVDATAGVGGGYRLGAGGRLPPLLLDDDEAVAIAVSLRLAAATTVSGVEPAAVASLAKLDQVLPVRLRERVRAIQASTVQLRGPELPQVDAEVLVTLATACREREALRFSYRNFDGEPSERRVEPYQIVHTGRRWYLVALDRSRRDWRTFRVDRITEAATTGHRFVLEDPPDAAALVSEGTTIAPYRIEARLRLALDAAEAVSRYPPTVGVVEASDGRTSVLRVAANGIGGLLHFVIGIDCDFEVLEPAELRDALRRLGRRLTRSAGRS